MTTRTRIKRAMVNAAFFILILLALVAAFFLLPWSKTKAEFERTVKTRTEAASTYLGYFSEEDIEGLPSPVGRYFRYCGYLGTLKMKYMKATFKDVDFVLSDDKTVKIDYTQYNFVNEPARIAYISSSMYAVPFEGFDSFTSGSGRMKGVIAKVVTLFDQDGRNMDRASLVTVLAECLLVPNVALQDYIVWEVIDETHVRARISHDGISASGIFTFDISGALISFSTDDRIATSMDGKEREATWTASFGDYREVNGIRQPRVLKSIWHYPEGDVVYFNENGSEVEIRYY